MDIPHLTSVPINSVVVPQGRRPIDEENVARLMVSMAQVGLRQPINILNSENLTECRLISGRHRLEAARRLGWKKITAVFFLADDKETIEVVEIVENLHRQDLSPTERLAAMKRLAELDVIMSERAEKEAVGKPVANATTIPTEAQRKKKSTGVGRGANQKKGAKPGTSRALADKFGVDHATAARDKKKIEALTGNDIVDRIAKLPQFDERGAIDALAKMDEATREATVAKAEAGEKVELKKPESDAASLGRRRAALQALRGNSFNTIAALLPRLTANERKRVVGMIADMDIAEAA